MSARNQQVVDALTAAIPRLQLAVRSAEQQQQDASAALDAVARAVTLLRPSTPSGGRTVQHLEQAVIRSGHTWAEVSHLSGLSRERLANLIAGDPPTKDERQALRRVLADWEG